MNIARKLFLALLFVTLSFYYSFSQVKILFDATKAETAGNADWVIDADNFNLDYNPDATLGGNESNAQQTPTPSQNNITSSTSETFWTGGISAWGIDAVKAGFYVETLPYNGRITYGDSTNPQDLSNYKVFVVCEPNIPFTNDEKTAILQFVYNGGGLFMISDHYQSDRNGDGYDSPTIWNDLMLNNTVESNPFGITFDDANFDETNANIATIPEDSILHGPWGDVTDMQFFAGTSISLNPSKNPTVKGLVYEQGYISGNYYVMAACARYGHGKVVAIGDSSPADDGTGDSNDNLYDGWRGDANGNHERFFMNATIWLATENVSESKTTITNKNQIVILGNKLKIISQTNQNLNLRLYNNTGQIIFDKQVRTNMPVELPVTKSGIYFYLISNHNSNIKSGKILLGL